MIDFQKKIKFLLDNLYKDETELTKAFIPKNNPTPKDIRSRKVAIKKWLNGISNGARFKEYEKYPIAKLKFANGMQLFPLSSFDWSFEKFKNRYLEYQKEKKPQYISLKDYRYIHYYNERDNKIVYFEIEYEDDNRVTIYTNHHPQIIIYKGVIKRHSNILYFIVSNSTEMMFLSFSEIDLKLDYDVYGLSLTKDYLLKSPKASIVLLSQNREHKKIFETKINISNIIIADNEKMGIEASFVNNLYNHLKNLNSVIDSYTTNNIFLNIFMEEFKLFYNKFEQFSNQYSHYISSFSKSAIKILNLLLKTNEKYHIQILYNLKDVNNSIFNHSYSDAFEIYNKIIELSQSRKISFEFIIVLGEKIVINRELKEKFKELEDANIPILFRRKEHIKAYSTIALIKNYKLAIFGLKGESRYKITNYQTDINKLKKEYEIQKRYAISLDEIIKERYPLNGTWYLYGYGTNNTLHFAIFNIDGNRIDITLKSHDNRKYKGFIQKVYDDILLCSNLAIIKFKNDKENPIIRVVSLMADQHNGNGKPVILYALFSRVELEESDRDKLFSSLIDRKSSPYDRASFKLSLSIDEILQPLLFKYEEIYKKRGLS